VVVKDNGNSAGVTGVLLDAFYSQSTSDCSIDFLFEKSLTDQSID